MTTATSTDANVFERRKSCDTAQALSRLETQIVDLEGRVDQVLADVEARLDGTQPPPRPEQVTVWGVPFSYMTLADTLRQVTRMIRSRTHGYFITANLNYNMLTARHPQLQKINDNAAFIVCDGMPMVWWSRLTGRRLPERVAGSELIYALTKWAAHQGHRVFFLGGAPGVAQRAADKLCERYPDLEVAGVECPPFRPLTAEEESAMIARIRLAQPDIVYIALGQPKGEIWMAENYRKLGCAVSVQIGASFDFVAGGVARAPLWMQRMGLEWFYRLLQEPRRLAGRYWHNGLFLLRHVARDLAAYVRQPSSAV